MFPSPADLPNPGIEPRSPALQVDSLPSEPPGKPSIYISIYYQYTICIYTINILLSRFRRVRLCVTPEMAAHQAPPSLGFSRQEHWNGLPFPSPMHESEKWKWSRSVVSNSLQPHGLQPTRLLRTWDFPGKSTGVGCHRLLWSIYYIYLYLYMGGWFLNNSGLGMLTLCTVENPSITTVAPPYIQFHFCIFN